MRGMRAFKGVRTAASEATRLVPWLFLILAMLGRFEATEHPRAVALVVLTWLLAVCSFTLARWASRWWRSRHPKVPPPPGQRGCV